MKTLNKQQGFTLVELIIVIVILGILAVTAAPRFLNFSGDAKISVLNTVKASAQTAAKMVYGKAVLQSQVGTAPTAANAGPEVEGVELTHGYPQATAEGIIAAIDMPDGWVSSSDVASGLVAETFTAEVAGPPVVPAYISAAGQIRIAAATADLANGGCYVLYTAAFKANATATETEPVTTVVTTGCN
ncbi:prepilin-type N-terminal cleavage/methylation domain-containing protein [Rheinheimera soli]|uniref:MSHA pilin protein MshA n=1 Tax=Rheinheimera soli TaxID=443616 RepID=A0ABU1W2C1_9GAMM|nr:prepilin-type N-terminal cleavage/methylation domain-containing protein [Rheinheimera soli]MDR7122120.1 MSHA pilin protein MshA [Rheinheimera soli]